MSNTNQTGRLVNNYLMMMALPLGLWFIVEYLMKCAAMRNIYLSLVTTPLMVVTPIALWYILRRLRRQILDDKISWFQAWTFGTQLMFFAGLIEALFIYIYNEFLFPNNLAEIQASMIAQYEESFETLRSAGAFSSMLSSIEDAIDIMREAPIASAIETAITQLSSDIFQGMLLMAVIAFIVRKREELEDID